MMFLDVIMKSVFSNLPVKDIYKQKLIKKIKSTYEGIVKPISKTQRYKMLGNAVSVPVITEIAHRLKHCLK